MNKHSLLRATLALGLAVTIYLAPAAPVGTAFTYQGKLSDGGNPANGTYDLTFALYDAAAGGTRLTDFLTNSSVVVSTGFFVATLDFGSNVFNGSSLWRQMGVRTNGTGGFTLTPRQS